MPLKLEERGVNRMNELVPFDQVRAVTAKTFQSVALALSQRIEGMEPLEAFSFLDGEVSAGTQLVQGSMLYTIHAIALAADKWEQMDVSQKEPIAETFYDYVSRKFGVSQSPSTVDNYINTARTWLTAEPRVTPPEKVFLFDLGPAGKPILLENDDGVAYEVPVNTWDVGYSKLLVSNARAAGEHMTEEDWGLLFNPDISQGELLRHYHGPKISGDDTPTPETVKFHKVAGMLCVTDGQDSVEIAELDLGMIQQSELCFRGWQAMRRLLSIREEEDF